MTDTIKLLEEKIRQTFSDVNCTSVLLGQAPRAIGIKTKKKKTEIKKKKKF